MLTTDGCCGSLVVGWKRPPQDPFMRTAVRSAPPPLLPPPPTPPAPPPSELTTPSRTVDHPWSAFVTPAAHLPNFRYSPAGKARFTAQEWAVVQSFLRWLVGSGGGGEGEGGGGEGEGGEGGEGEARVASSAAAAPLLPPPRAPLLPPPSPPHAPPPASAVSWRSKGPEEAMPAAEGGGAEQPKRRSA